MNNNTREFGFTLVELLLTLAIVGVLLSLVAPLGSKQIDRARGVEEVAILARVIESVEMEAFMFRTDLRVEFRGRSVQWRFGSENHSVAFRFLMFQEPIVMIVNRNGIPDVEAIRFIQGASKKELKTTRWVD